MEGEIEMELKGMAKRGKIRVAEGEGDQRERALYLLLIPRRLGYPPIRSPKNVSKKMGALQESSTSVELLSAYFINSQEGWVVGGEGTILHTTDGGNTWVKQQSGTQFTLNDVQFVDEQEGWIVGTKTIRMEGKTNYKGIILHTVDGGKKWETVRNVPARLYWLKDVHFVNPQTGWIVGLGLILHTEDGGKSWKNQRNFELGSRFYSIYFLDDLTGWMIGTINIVDENGNIRSVCAIAHSVNGGYNWEIQYYKLGVWFRTLFFANLQEGWAVGANGIFHTADSGRTWSYQPSLGHRDAELRSICYGGRGVLWAVGEYGTLLRYHDPDLQVIPPSYWAVEPRGKGISPWGGIKQEGKHPVTSALGLRNQLHQNYPNPFNLETWIPFQLAGESEVIIRIYDVQGRLVRELLLGRRGAGYYLDKRGAARWDGRDEMGIAVPSGVYFYTLTAKGYTATRKLVLIK